MTENTKLKYISGVENPYDIFLCSDSDVKFVVGDHTYRAHRSFLSGESGYFQNMFKEGFIEGSMSEIPLKDTPAEAFKILLRCLYTGQVNLIDADFQNVVDLLELAHRYQFEELSSCVLSFLEQSIDVDKFYTILAAAKILDFNDLLQLLENFCKLNGGPLINEQKFLDISSEHVCLILQWIKDTLLEVDLFKAAQKWIQNKTDAPKECIDQILSCIDLTQMKSYEILTVVRESNFYNGEFLLDALALKGAAYKVLRGTNSQYIFIDSDEFFVDSEVTVQDGKEKFSVYIDFGQKIRLNNLEFKFKEMIRSGYSIVASLDSQEESKTLINYDGYRCFDKQQLFFETTEIQFLRIISSENFSCNSLNFSIVSNMPELKNGFICPRENICTELRSKTYPESFNLILKDRNKTNIHCAVESTIEILFKQPYWIDCCDLQFDKTNYKTNYRLQSYDLQFFGARTKHKNWSITTAHNFQRHLYYDATDATTSIKFLAKNTTVGNDILLRQIIAYYKDN